jgi:hypothetical protein
LVLVVVPVELAAGFVAALDLFGSVLVCAYATPIIVTAVAAAIVETIDFLDLMMVSPFVGNVKSLVYRSEEPC